MLAAFAVRAHQKRIQTLTAPRVLRASGHIKKTGQRRKLAHRGRPPITVPYTESRRYGRTLDTLPPPLCVCTCLGPSVAPLHLSRTLSARTNTRLHHTPPASSRAQVRLNMLVRLAIARFRMSSIPLEELIAPSLAACFTSTAGQREPQSACTAGQRESQSAWMGASALAFGEGLTHLFFLVARGAPRVRPGVEQVRVAAQGAVGVAEMVLGKGSAARQPPIPRAPCCARCHDRVECRRCGACGGGARAERSPASASGGRRVLGLGVAAHKHVHPPESHVEHCCLPDKERRH